MSDVTVKKEGMDLAEVESRIKALCQQFPHGITDAVIQNDMPHLDPQQRALAITSCSHWSVPSLCPGGQLDLLRNSSGLLYRMKDGQGASKMKGSDNQEKLVYQVIEDAGNKGEAFILKSIPLLRYRIWSRDIRFKSNLPLTEASKKKVYMLYNIQPDRSVTGGAWYSDQDFESEFVEAEAAKDSKQSPMIQRNSSLATSHEVWKYICELGISKVELTVIAAKEGTVGSVDGQMKLYRGVNAVLLPTGMVRTPCGLCPVFDDCQEGGEISPSNCIYMTEWLDF
ncbi:hypothetical protein F7725_012174 [Dissostichus mawsoni]|uniref:DNA-directed RNA polymerase III subunit RPC6 n=1 Tax=Dissostichus mawsoni TaxID=36200 RepID=A0A7J5YLN0_DISMA|nr:hypothetical protein F7725_012174 [Dissostichus mawsoni]